MLPQPGPDLHRADPHAGAGARVADAERIAADEVEANYQPSDPFADGARLGPLSSQAQVERVTGYIQKGIDEGAKLVTGGPERPEGFEEGYYVRPTVFSEVSNDMTIAQEEIFGPVLSIIAYEDEDEAARIANDSVYGLSGGVWSADAERAQAVRPPDPHRPDRGERRRLQPERTVRWLQEQRLRSRVRTARLRGVPRDQGDAALGLRRTPTTGRERPRALPRRVFEEKRCSAPESLQRAVWLPGRAAS